MEIQFNEHKNFKRKNSILDDFQYIFSIDKGYGASGVSHCYS